ncbi:CRISPR-associated endonuclease Cas4g/Cas1g [Roseospira visakhapatnamensis]|uniref:CRISPR-associated endonuclease Cas1 n=1 Tax=Roseospira visakhapatnamensis TaxID=390880 RepID=A0A7W6RCU1_9PROT|nr:CRISPR-associated endonuclease Cas1 [Roseospira visakhapatnamensis]MBB4266155.1 CRISPR-associated endonuclease Cas1/CRISPR-associated protein Cas4 [Roseospira visakhapatnamensis]
MTDRPDPNREPELPLPAPPAPEGAALVPVRMVSEYVYCPRVAWLMWVDGAWTDTADTEEGRQVHKRVDAGGGTLPDAPPDEDDTEDIHARSVALTSERLGITGVLDLVEGDGGRVSPVDTKRGKRPHVALGAYDPERVQVCLQGLLLEEHGYRCHEGFLYYRASRERVRVPFDDALRQAALHAVHGLRLAAAQARPPPPLIDSPKCPRCALVGICLPDEIGHALGTAPAPRPLAAARPDALPLIVQAGHGKVGKSGGQLVVTLDDAAPVKARLPEVSQLVVFGNVSVTAPALHEMMRREIPVSWHSHGGWFLGHTVGLGHRTVAAREAQYRCAFDPGWSLRFARGAVAAKIRNARTLLRRNRRDTHPPDAATETLRALKRLAGDAGQAHDTATLLGIEGAAAAAYFGAFPLMLKEGGPVAFDFRTRNRRPPTDPVNALLSFAYALLVRTWHVALSAVGLDPYRGFYHTVRHGRPALALDMMEPDRPLIAESAVLTVINNGEVAPGDFVHAAGSCAMAPAARKALIAAFERRLEQDLTHPVFGYQISYRRLIEVQARLLCRHLHGEIDTFPWVTPR